MSAIAAEAASIVREILIMDYLFGRGGERLGLNRETPDLCLTCYGMGGIIVQLSGREKSECLQLCCWDAELSLAST